MFDALFRREPQYDENGRVIGYSQPKIVWIIFALVVLYCFKDKLMKQKGGMKDVGTTGMVFFGLYQVWEKSWVFRISIISLVIMISAPALWEWYQYLRGQYRIGGLRDVVVQLAAVILPFGVLVFI